MATPFTSPEDISLSLCPPGKRAFDSVLIAGFGDAPNNIPLLRVIDHPIVAARRDGSIHPEMIGLGFLTTRGAGPEGWNRAALHLIAILNL